MQVNKMAWMRSVAEGSLLVQADLDQLSIEKRMTPLKLEDGSLLRVFDIGHGTPIIFMPMIKELNFVYAPQIEAFQTSHRIILYEPRLRHDSHLGIVERATETFLLIESLGLPGAHIVAWSDTGSVAYSLARQSPDKCKSIIFLGLADRYVFALHLQFLIYLLSILPLEGLIPSWLLARILGSYLGGPRVKSSWVSNRASQIPQLARLFKHSILPNLLEHLPVADEIKVPCLLLCGDRDALVSPEQARRMARLLPKAGEAIIIPGGEHLLGYVSPLSVNPIMRQFYASLND